MIKFLKYAAVTIGVLVVILLVVGYSLPQNHVASVDISLGAPVETVFGVVSDVGRYAEWRPGIDRVEVLSTGPLRWREHAGGDTITFEVVESKPPDRLQVRIADPDLPFGGTWTYDLAPAEGGGTRLLIVENGEVYNPIFRVVSRFIFGHHATLNEFAEALKRKLQS